MVNQDINYSFSSTDAFDGITSATLNTGNGRYYLHVQARDAAGNLSNMGSYYVDIDTTAPSVIGLSNDVVSRVSKNWAWGCSEATCTYRHVVNQSSTHTFTTSDAFGSETTATRASGDGTYYLHVQARDAVGLTSPVVSVSAALSSTAFAVTGLTADITPTRSKTWTWGCSGGGTCTYRFAVNQSPTHNFGSGDTFGSAVTTTHSTGDGTYYLHVQARNSSDEDSAVTTVAAVLDNTAPRVTDLNTPDSRVDIVQSYTWNWGCSDGTACEYRFVLTRQMAHTFGSGDTWGSVTTATQSSGDGNFYIHVQARDQAGNISSTSTTYAVLDNTGPIVFVSPVGSAPKQSHTWSWECNEEDRSSCMYRFVTNQDSSYTFSNEPFVASHSAVQADGDGTYYLHIQGQDSHGNVGSSISVQVLMDNTGPTLTGLADDSSPRQSKTWNWGCSDESCTYRFAVNQSPNHSFSNEAFAATATATQGNGDGTYYVHVQAQDAAGNIGDVASFSALLDNTRPGVTGLSNDEVVRWAKTWNWGCSEAPCSYRYVINQTASAPDPINVEWGNDLSASQSAPTNTQHWVSSSGIYYLHIQSRDVAGNESVVESYSVRLTAGSVTLSRSSEIDSNFQRLDYVLSCGEGLTCSYRFKLNGAPTESYSSDTAVLFSQAQKQEVYVQGRSDGTESVVTRVLARPYNRLDAHHGTACAVQSDRVLMCWGKGSHHQLATGNTNNALVPVEISGLSDVVQVAVGWKHVCALKATGVIHCWGEGGEGRLGIGNQNTLQRVGSQVSGINNAVYISAGNDHTCASLSHGKIKCWGRNDKGQLGDNSTTNRSTPVEVKNINNSIQVSAGHKHTCALLTDGSVKCWGYRKDGRVGGSTSGNALTPVSVSGLSNVAQIASSGDRHNCALLTNGRVKCWGEGQYGRLGNGSTRDSGTPVDVRGLDNVTQISVGQDFSCAIKTNWEQWCWGRGWRGRLARGYGGLTNRDSNVPVHSCKKCWGATEVAAAHTSGCMLKNDGRVHCWGNNGQDGRFGMGHSYSYAATGFLVRTSTPNPPTTSDGNFNMGPYKYFGTNWPSYSCHRVGSATNYTCRID